MGALPTWIKGVGTGFKVNDNNSFDYSLTVMIRYKRKNVTFDFHVTQKNLGICGGGIVRRRENDRNLLC